ncbi:MAG TPA: sigma-70 family RNA polymerase sigma factor [Saprospiraceae bacterium]|nr:sigma-70 family RNA polymerase sigma factor [Saprospiraceae bacterium]
MQDRDRSTCKLIYDTYSSVCLGICLRYARKRVDAEDMLQDGFLEVFQSIHTYSFNGSFEGWLKKVIIHQVFNYIRKHYKISNEIEEFEFVEASVQNDHSLEEVELLSIINSIPEKYKISFNLHAIEKYSHKEIAALLSIEESTSRSQFLRARNMIKKKLEDIQNFENKISQHGA